MFAVLAAAFVTLGQWQARRAEEKTALTLQFEQAPSLPGLPPGPAAPRFSRVRLDGVFDARRHILADNQVLNGRSGVHVLSPFSTSAGATILVNRGWLPMAADRRSLPAIATPAGAIEIEGHLDRIPDPARKLGADDVLAADRWPQLMTYPDLDAIAVALAEELHAQVLMLDADSPGGFEGRDWQPVRVSADRHRAYALQWRALALLALALWLLLGVRRARLVNP